MRSSAIYLASLSNVLGLSFERNTDYSSVCDEHRKCYLVEGRQSSSHAYGVYNEDIHSDGWGKLWVHSDDSKSSWYEAGFVEGSLTSSRIYEHYWSWYPYTFGTGNATKETIDFIMDQYEYAVKLVNENENDPYYSRLGDVLDQMHGIHDGMNQYAESGKTLTLEQILLLEAAGDLFDIIPAVNPKLNRLTFSLSRADYYDMYHKQVSCSSLIKINDDISDVFVAHTSWSSYQNMLRIYKNYDFMGGSYQLSSSGRPGMVYSKDDFYVLPQTQLTVIETTNGILSSEMYSLITPLSLLTWQRIPMSNSLAIDGSSWTSIFSQHNSGTYANMWMVVDMKLFTPFVGPTATDFLWIIEVAPGIAARYDNTEVLIQNGNYWPSYNVPYDKEVYVKSGFQAAYEQYGDHYSYENSTRAKIFARDQHTVQSFEDMKRMIRFNGYATDPLSNGDPYDTICSRKDLRTGSMKAGTNGGIDGKVTSYSRIASVKTSSKPLPLACAISGPPHDESGDLPVWVWSESAFSEQAHLGQPDAFDFDFVEMDFYQF